MAVPENQTELPVMPTTLKDAMQTTSILRIGPKKKVHENYHHDLMRPKSQTRVDRFAQNSYLCV